MFTKILFTNMKDRIQKRLNFKEENSGEIF